MQSIEEVTVTRCPLATNLAEFGSETFLAGHRAPDGVLAPDTVAGAGAGSLSSGLAPSPHARGLDDQLHVLAPSGQITLPHCHFILYHT